MKIISLEQIPHKPVSHNPKIHKKIMLSAGDVPHVTNFSQSYFPPGQVATAHQHDDMYEVFFVESGTGIIRVGGTRHALETGMCVTVEPGEMHEITNTCPTDLVLTYLGVQA